QLAGALCFLHEAGRLHRDIKPSNVMVTRDGRVVLLDFGLVVDLTAEGGQSTGIVGTPAYMAPEQAGEEPVAPAADWYAVGVMLYQALSGRLPFDGSAAMDMVGKKLTTDPHPPSAPPAHLPHDLH